jgi:hypothetical protein
MKLLYSTLLGTLIFAAVGVVSFAEAPTWKSIPDVVIGDREDWTGEGQTIDTNFFRYLNAFNALDYINNPESAPTDNWLISFREETTHDDLSINDKAQLTDAESAEAPPTAKQLQADGFWMSFRDLVRSPASGSSPFSDPVRADASTVGKEDYEFLPWHKTDGSDALGGGDYPTERVITLYLTDQVTGHSSRSVVVQSLNYGYDDLSAGATTLFTDDLTTLDNWTFTTAFSPAPTGTGSGYISLTSVSGQQNFGRWSTTFEDAGIPGFPIYVNGVIPHIEDTNRIYCARYTMSHNATDRALVPNFRIGAANGGNTIQLINVINSIDGTGQGADYNPHLPDAATDTVFTFYWSANSETPNFSELYQPTLGTGFDARTWGIFFDLFDEVEGEEDVGTITLKNIEVRDVPRPNDLSSGDSGYSEITDLTASGGFATNPSYSTENVTVAGGSPSGTMITFTDNGPLTGDGPTYLVWEKQDALTWTADVVARISADISCPTTADRGNFKRFRVRHQHEFLAISQVFQVRQNFASNGNPQSPIARDGNDALCTRYETYLGMYGGPSTFITTNDYDDFLVSVDQLHNLANADGSGSGDDLAARGVTHTTVHKLVYEMLPISEFAAGEN